MQPDELERIIGRPEGLKLDFKREFYRIADSDYSPSTPEQERNKLKESEWGELLKDVLSIANGNVNTATQEGYLIIGVEDKTKAKFDVGCVDPVEFRKRLIQRLTDICSPPLADIHCDVVEIEGKRLLLITIPPSPHLHETVKDLKTHKRVFPKHTVFVRRGEEVGPASQAERMAILTEKGHRLAGTTNDVAQATSPSLPGKLYRLRDHVIPVGVDSAARINPTAPRERFAESITAWMSNLKRKVEWLTNDQTQVLHQLRYAHRALVSGCAGSGKTLLVAEKAIRLDAAGVRTLVLCHNPNLARYISSLIAKPTVDVYDFTTFVSRLAGKPAPERAAWTAFEDPLDEDLNVAFDAVGPATTIYEAIIVDEAQDFRDEWWVLVDALLQYSSMKTLYVFYDDNQALLPHRAHYPIDCHPISMSRNCRNGGNIFEIVRRFHRDAPLTSSFLTNDGIARITPFNESDFRIRLENALLDAYNYAGHNQIRVLTNEPAAESSVLNGFEFTREAKFRWRPVVCSHLHAMRNKALKRAARLKSGNSNSEISNRFGIPQGQSLHEYLTVPSLSQDNVPNAEDVRTVQEYATKLLPFFGGIHNTTVRFTVRDGELRLTADFHTGRHEVAVNDTSRVRFYSQSKWASALRAGRATKVQANLTPGLDEYEIPLYSVDAYKGLECDALVLVINSASHNLLREMYVGSSRAVCYLNVVINRSVLSRLTSLEDLDERFHAR